MEGTPIDKFCTAPISLKQSVARTVQVMAITPPRSVRIPDVLWRKAKAKTQHTTVTAVIVKAFYDWVSDK